MAGCLAIRPEIENDAPLLLAVRQLATNHLNRFLFVYIWNWNVRDAWRRYHARRTRLFKHDRQTLFTENATPFSVGDVAHLGRRAA